MNRVVAATLVLSIVCHASTGLAEDCAELQSESSMRRNEAAGLRDEWPRILADLRAGVFCSKCKRTPVEIQREENEAFGSHLGRVKGTAEPASAELIEKRRMEHQRKVDAATRDYEQAAERFDRCVTTQKKQRIQEKAEQEKKDLEEYARTGVMVLRFESEERRRQAQRMEDQAAAERRIAESMREQAREIQVDPYDSSGRPRLSTAQLQELELAELQSRQRVVTEVRFGNRPSYASTVAREAVSDFVEERVDSGILDGLEAAGHEMGATAINAIRQIQSYRNQVQETLRNFEQLRSEDPRIRSDAQIALSRRFFAKPLLGFWSLKMWDVGIAINRFFIDKLYAVKEDIESIRGFDDRDFLRRETCRYTGLSCSNGS